MGDDLYVLTVTALYRLAGVIRNTKKVTFERVVSTFMLHHLDLDVKLGMLREARRVLKSDGELHLVDFGRQDAGKDGMLAGLLHSHEKLAENLGGRIGELFREAGFDDVAEVSQNKTIFGRYVHVRGVAH